VRLDERVRTALVTGGSRGFGRALTLALVDRGAEVWCTSRKLDQLPDIDSVHPLRFDLERPGDAASLIETAERVSGGIELLVCNAGFGVFGPFDRVAWPEWAAQVDAQLTVTMELVHRWSAHALPRGRGKLVLVSSLAAEFPIPGLGAYSAAKAGLSAWARALELEWEGRGIQVIDLRLGDLRTGFNATARRPAATPEIPASQLAKDPVSLRFGRVWNRLEETLAAAPTPEAAVGPLLDTLLGNRSRILRVGSFLQASLLPFLARLAPLSVQQKLARRYFNL
jgi:NAD(P)-dependent dehydrogenase (short-subunit alcohol dehydrogenase family)